MHSLGSRKASQETQKPGDGKDEFGNACAGRSVHYRARRMSSTRAPWAVPP